MVFWNVFEPTGLPIRSKPVQKLVLILTRNKTGHFVSLRYGDSDFRGCENSINFFSIEDVTKKKSLRK